MGLEYKKILLQNIMDCSGMGLDNHDEIIKQAIEWTIDDCMNHLNNELRNIHVRSPCCAKHRLVTGSGVVPGSLQRVARAIDPLRRIACARDPDP